MTSTLIITHALILLVGIVMANVLLYHTRKHRSTELRWLPIDYGDLMLNQN